MKDKLYKYIMIAAFGLILIAVPILTFINLPKENRPYSENENRYLAGFPQISFENYLNKKEMSRLNRLVTMFIDYAELMAEDEVLMSMQDWVDQTNQFLSNNRREVLEGKGKISHEQAIEKAAREYDIFRVRQDQEYVSEFDKQTEKYFKGE